MPTTAPPLARTLTRAEWIPVAAAHADRADALTAGHRARSGRGQAHAVEDFLYDYYSTKPSLLRRWHPGIGVVLEGADEHAGWRWYTADAAGARVDAAAFYAARGSTVDWVAGLLAATASRAVHLGCFGMHEWAMVYRTREGARRHGLPLRLGEAGTDAVVESHPVQCTHYDAFRFFTDAARPLNATQPTRASQIDMEQPGCLHATMDLYKWAAKLSPAVPSDLALDAFALAMEVRRVDMRASPYDVSSYGLRAIAVETPAGKREYAAHQRAFMERGAALRERLLAACAAIRDAAVAEGAGR